MSTRYTNQFEALLSQSIRLVFAAQARKAFPEVLSLWEEMLRPHDGPHLVAVLADMAQASKMPNVGEIVRAVVERKRRSQPFVPPTLTAAERTRSEHAAVMSMLWMRKEYPQLNESAELIMRSVFARQFGKDATTAVNEAKSAYTPEQLDAWMEDAQRRAS